VARTTSESEQRRALNVDEAVRSRYSRAATQTESELCCPVEYDKRYLEMIPDEILQRDYGCGDPSRHVHAGETVLDLGCGGGKVCYILSQIVGRTGRTLGVDCNDDMLALARKYQPQMDQKLGFHNIEFHKGKIQDLQLDLELLDEYLAGNPVKTSSDWLRLEEHAQFLRETSPLIPDHSIDVIVSNCVLNLVRPEDRRQLFVEMFRVLKRGGRAVICDIVSDEEVPTHMQNDAQLWSGCISGASREDRFFEAFEAAGFYGCEIVTRQSEPWAVVEGIEFRSMTLRAFKGKDAPCLDRKQAVIYNGPWKAVIDDDGHKLLRGQRMAVCDKTFSIYTGPPYAGQVTAIQPHDLFPRKKAPEFSCNEARIRSARETKGDGENLTVLPEGECCGSDGCC